MNYAYLRVSTDKQDEKRQEMSLSHINIHKKYIDKLSGKNTDRPKLNQLQLDSNVNDNIFCESISRLGRNVDDLRKLVEYFKDKGVIVHFIKEGFNTNGTTYKFLLTILGAVAETGCRIYRRTFSRNKHRAEDGRIESPFYRRNTNRNLRLFAPSLCKNRNSPLSPMRATDNRSNLARDRNENYGIAGAFEDPYRSSSDKREER